MLTAPLRTQMLVQLEALRRFDFQQAIVDLLFLVHSPAGFTDIREVGDEGCDGIIQSDRCVVACYGPEDRAPKKFAPKISADHRKYAKNWRNRFPNWRVFINRQPSPVEIKLVEALHPGAELWGVHRIVRLVEELAWGKRLKYCELLRIDEDLVGRDFLRLVLDDLVTISVPFDSVAYRTKAPQIRRKLDCNYPERELDAIASLVSSTYEQQHAAEAALQVYDGRDLAIIKGRIVMDFESITGVENFGDRLRLLREKYSAKYNRCEDDGLDLYIAGLLFLIFTQCLIGKEPEGAP